MTKPDKGLVDFIGKKFGCFTVIGRAETETVRWVVRCECGAEKVVSRDSLYNAKGSKHCIKCKPRSDYAPRERNPWPTPEVELMRQKFICRPRDSKD